MKNCRCLPIVNQSDDRLFSAKLLDDRPIFGKILDDSPFCSKPLDDSGRCKMCPSSI